LDRSPPPLGRVVVEGTLLVNRSSVNISAVYIEIKGGTFIIADLDSDGNVIGAYSGNCTINLLGTNARLTRVFGSDPRETPEIKLGRQAVRLGAGVIGVFGTFAAIGKPVQHAWVRLAATAVAGQEFLVLETSVDWAVGSEISISPTDFEPHEAEIHTIGAVETRLFNQKLSTVLNLTRGLQFSHYGGAWEVYGSRRMRMRAEVALLSRNIVIRGEGEGEESFYTTWNVPKGENGVCNNGVCEIGENSQTCKGDCRGPIYEYGASIMVSTYSEDAVICSKEGVCNGGFLRAFVGKINISNVELRYFGQNNLQAGLVLENLQPESKDSSNSISNVSFNKGYFGALLIKSCVGVLFQNSVIFRAILPSVEVKNGTGNQISGVLAISGIFWHTHRGATQVLLFFFCNCSGSKLSKNTRQSTLPRNFQQVILKFSLYFGREKGLRSRN
jgi:hypothetical protein